LQADKQLWLKIAEGDQQAYAEVYRFYYKRFYNYGKKFTDSDALLEDSIQEVLLIIWDKRHTLSTIEHAGTYFYTSFRHSLLQKLRQQRKFVSDGHQKIVPEFGADQVIISKETDAGLKEQLQRALHTLTPRQREAIFLRFYEGLSYEQVALVLEITTKATYKIMARALLQLKEKMLLSSGILLCILNGWPSLQSF
jgi:RNA polymerase sigma factor (sigma-70 family)